MPIRAAILTLSLTLAPASQDATRPAQPPAPASNTPSRSAAEPRPMDPEAQRREKEADLRRRYVASPSKGDRLDRLPEELGFDEEGRVGFVEVRSRYDAAWKEIQGEETRQLSILLRAAFRYDHLQSEFVAVHTPELLAVLRLRDRLASKVDAAEDALAKEVFAFTAPEQRSAYHRWHLERIQELYGHPAKLPAAGLNLIELFPKAGLTAEELAPLESGLDAYAKSLADEIRARHIRLVELEDEEAEALVSLGPEWRAGRTPREALDVERELAQLAVAETLADMPLRDLNQSSFAQLRRQLVPAAAKKATEAYQRLVHPGIFEDEHDFRGVIEEMLALPTIGQDQIAAVVETLNMLEERLRPTSQQAVELSDGLIAASRLAAADAASARILLEQKLQDVLARRRTNVREGLRQLTALLSAEQAAFASRIDDALATLDAQDRAGRFLSESLAARSEELATLYRLGEEPLEAPVENSAPPTNPAEQPTSPPDAANAPPVLDENGRPIAPSEKPKSDRERRGRGSRRDRP